MRNKGMERHRRKCGPLRIWAESEGQPARPEFPGGPEMTQNPSGANQAPTSQIKISAAADRPLLNVTSRPMSITSSPARFSLPNMCGHGSDCWEHSGGRSERKSAEEMWYPVGQRVVSKA